ncbi:MAG: hypothetical protein WAN20_02840 [Pseudonocardiaceae bacterium]
MSVNNPDELLHTVLPPALEVLTAWSIAETEADPTVFHHAMNRAFGDAAGSPDPWRGFADPMFGLSSLSGILSTSSPRPPAGPAAMSCTPATCATSTPKSDYLTDRPWPPVRRAQTLLPVPGDRQRRVGSWPQASGKGPTSGTPRSKHLQTLLSSSTIL